MRRHIVICLAVVGVGSGLAVVAAGCGRTKQDYSVPGLITSLQSQSTDARRAAATVLGKYAPQQAQEAVPALTAALKDQEKYVRLAAAYSLARFGTSARDALPALKETLNDKDPKVREAAAYAYRQIQNPKPKPPKPKKKG